MKIYKALYNPCIHESAWHTLSIHRTRRGAEMAMEFHKNEEKEKYDKYIGDDKFGEHEDWCVWEDELLD